MAEGYNFLEGSQTDINRRLLRKIQALEKATGIDTSDIDDLQETVGDENSGLVKDVADLKTAIGTDETADSIKGRLYALEHPANNG